MHAGDDLVWSLGIGCDGIIHLLLQKLDRDSARSMFDWLSRSQAARQSVLLALSLGEEPPQVLGQLGAANSKGEQFGDSGLATLASRKAAIGWPHWRYQKITGPNILLINIPPQPRILICGAGPDAVPVAQQFIHLGWECVVVDHRAAYACTGRFTEACETIVTRPEKLHLVVALEQLDAAIIMSHHLENDASYLRQLAPMLRDNPNQDLPGKLAYLGVLGPGSRRDKLREMAACPQAGICGPVGLDIGAELPEGIALSIAAEVHAALNCRNGLSLTLKTISPE
jgi:xanthine/CO dehydrogenase XdhC/CoxF family maturation factor